jgi:hypothetical protein
MSLLMGIAAKTGFWECGSENLCATHHKCKLLTSTWHGWYEVITGIIAVNMDTIQLYGTMIIVET